MTSRDTLSGQSPDILQHLFTHLKSSTLIQVWKTCKVFHRIVSRLVPIKCNITFVEEGLRLIPLFKKIRFEIEDGYHFDDNKLKQLDKYIVTLSISGLISITDEGLKHLINLTYLNIYNCRYITDEGIIPLIHMKHLQLSNCPDITNDGIIGMKSLRTLHIREARHITYDCIQHLPNLKKVYMYINNLTFEYKEKLLKRGITVCLRYV